MSAPILGLVPRRCQTGEGVDYIGSNSKCGDRRVRTLLYEAANVMLTRYKGQLKLKDWAFAIAKRSTMRKARKSLWARRLAIIMHAERCETERSLRSGLSRARPRDRIMNPAPKRSDALGREQSRQRRNFQHAGQPMADCGFQTKLALHPAYPIKCRTSTQRKQASPFCRTGGLECVQVRPAILNPSESVELQPMLLDCFERRIEGLGFAQVDGIDCVHNSPFGVGTD